MPRSTHAGDGSKRRFAVGFPFLDRAHVFVTVNDVGMPFAWISDTEIEMTVAPLKDARVIVQRMTPDNIGFADIKDTTVLTAEQLARMRLQLLFLIQERSLALGNVGGAINAAVNEFSDIADVGRQVRDALAALTKDLQTLDDLQAAVAVQGNLASQTRDQLLAEIDTTDREIAAILNRVQTVETNQAGFGAQVSNETIQRMNGDSALAGTINDVRAVLETEDTAIKASVQSANLARVNADNALATAIEDIRVNLETADTALGARITTAEQARVAADNALASRISTLEASGGGTSDEVRALINQEATARANADSAMTSRVDTLQSTVTSQGQTLGTVQTSVNTLADRTGRVESQWVLKVQSRSDGKQVFAGIGVASSASSTSTQSEIILQADRLVLVPGSNINATPQPILAAGQVNGVNTFVFNSSMIGDKTVGANVLVDGVIQARHLSANSITADKIDTRGLSIRDAAGNIILAAGTPLAASALPPEANAANVANGGCINRDPSILMPSVWSRPGAVTILGPSDTAGATAGLYLSCSSGVDQIAWDVGPAKPGGGSYNYPLDPGRTYNLNANLYMGPGNNRNMYLIVDMFDVSGNRVATTWGGTYSGYTFGGQLPSQGRWFRAGSDFGAGTQRPIPGNVVTCRIGVWFQYSSGSSQVQQAAQDIRLVDVTDGRTADWGTVASRPRVLEAVSAGYQNTTAPRSPGVWVDGAYLAGPYWWSFAWLNPSTLALAENYTVGPGGGTPDTAADKLEWYINNNPNVILVVTTSDHPSGMYNARMLEALYRYGASRGGLGSDAFLGTFRAAYSLIGRPNSPPGSGVESFTRTSSAHCVSTALIKDGMILNNQKDFQVTPGNASTFIANAAIGSAQVGTLTAQNLTVGAISGTVNGGTSSGGRIEITTNRIQVFDEVNALRARFGYLL